MDRYTARQVLTSADGLLGGHQTHHLQVLASLQLALLDSAGDHSASAGDGEGVLHGHQEGLVSLAHRRGDGCLHLNSSSKTIRANHGQ